MEEDAPEEIWAEFRSTGSIEARNLLMVHYTPLVRKHARRIAAGLPSNVEADDLMSSGLFGLMQVLSSYDPERGVKFSTFAASRIWGSMYDELRRMDWVPRSVHSKARDAEDTAVELQAELGRDATEVELAERMNISIRALRTIQAQAHSSSLAPLEQPSGSDRASISEATFDPSSNPEELFFATTEISELVANAVNHMDGRHKTILVLYYLQEMTLAEIGEVLGVTESRVCQLQSKVLQSLRDSLGQGMLAAS